MNVLRETLLNRRLKRTLARHGCHMASRVETLRDGTQVTLEPNVELGKARIHSPALEVGAYTDVASGCELLEVADIGRLCSITTGMMIGQPRRSHPMHWLNTHAFTANSELLRKPLQPKHETTLTRISHDVWVGRGALIPDGVETGTDVVIGAQSLVNRDVSPHTMVAGSPTWVLCYRFAPELTERLLANRWWGSSLDVFGELPLDNPQACVEALEHRPPQVCQETRRLRIRHKPFAIE